MPRPASHTTETLTDRALVRFWEHGFNATSMDDLVKATGVSRHGIYAAFGGKRDLFLACFERYRDLVVSPAFEAVEDPAAGLGQVAAYFEHHIARGEAAGLPGPGCFVANSATEVAPADADVLAKVRRHNDRLFRGFRNAVRNSMPATTADVEIDAVADAIVVFTNGLWSASRTISDGDRLRACVKIFLRSLKGTMP